MKLYRFLIIYLFKLLSLPLAQTTVLLFLLFPLKFVCASEPGRISISIYKQNQTFKNFNVELNNKTFQTDEDGVLVQSFPEGIVQLKITHPDGEKVIEKNISVVSHLDTFVLINFDKDQVHFDINAPKVYEVEDKIENSVLFKGKVIAIGQEQELAGVKVFVKGLSQNATTNYRGEFELKVPKGKVLMSLSHSSYNTLSQEIEVNDDEQVFHKISMVPKGLELEDFIVLAPRQRGSVEELIQVRQNSTNVADVMSAEQMSKSGDSDAASSLKRVTGLTLIDGKFVYVRGLGERYSNTLLNGVAIPSPDPSRRVVPLDLFPVGVLENMVIQKSYSPDRTGEFGGGSIMLQMKSFPEKSFFKASVSQTFYNDSGDNFMSYQGGKKDWLGIDDGTRRLPNGLAGGNIVSGEALQSFNNVNNVSETKRNPIPSLSAVYGNGYKQGRFRLSHLSSIIYGYNQKTQREESFGYKLVNGLPVQETNNLKKKSIADIKLGGLLGLGASYNKKHKLQMNYLVARKTTDTTALGEGFNFDFNTNIKETQLQWTERDLRSFIVNGEHKFRGFNKPEISWHLSYSKARLYEPDERNSKYVLDETTGEYNFLSFAEAIGYTREFADLSENVRDVALSYTQPVNFWGGRKAEVKVGLNKVDRGRNSEVLRYALSFRGENLKPYQHLLSKTVEEIIDSCLKPDCLQYEDNSLPTDSYQANQNVISYFVNSKWPVLAVLDLSMGVRIEESNQDVSTFANLSATDEIRQSRLKTIDHLPIFYWTWRMSDKMQLRWAYSETVSRPDFKELSDSLWRDDDRDINVVGNPNLKAAVITNMDLRWEWYFSRMENISFGIFSKDFIHPIEEISVGASDPVLTFANAEKAKNVGYEIEFRKNLGFLHSSLGPLSWSGNFSQIDSKIFLDNLDSNVNLTTRKRALQGQSPYVINTMLDYNWEKKKTNLSMVYNIFGKRITEVSTDGIPDVYEQPRHQVDFVASHELNEKAQVKLKISNLLSEDAVYKIGDQVRRSKTRDQAVGLSLSMSL